MQFEFSKFSKKKFSRKKNFKFLKITDLFRNKLQNLFGTNWHKNCVPEPFWNWHFADNSLNPFQFSVKKCQVAHIFTFLDPEEPDVFGNFTLQPFNGKFMVSLKKSLFSKKNRFSNFQNAMERTYIIKIWIFYVFEC